MASDWSFGAHFRSADAAPAQPGLPQVGQLFGVYRIAGTLGEGAHGVVYCAQGPSGRDVAVKVLKSRLDPSRRDRFRREGEIAAALNHPGILRILSGGEWGGLPFLVYERVEGAREFDEYVQGLGLDERVRALRHVAEAVGYAHERGVVHRDLKAANVLVDDTGRVRVADFGLAKEAGGERLTRTGAILGTPVSMAPEQIVAGVDQVSAPTDVWALGVMLYEAICGRLPFDAESFPELQAKVLGSDPERPGRIAPGVSPGLEAVCLKALEKDPAHRYPDGAAFAADLGRALAGEPTHAGSGPRGSRRRSLIALAVVAALAFAVLLGGWLALRAPSTRAPARRSVVAEPVAVAVEPESTPLQGTPGELSDLLNGALRFMPGLRAECGVSAPTPGEWGRLRVWRAVFCPKGTWAELGRAVDPGVKTRLGFVLRAAQRDPERYRRLAFACYLKAWEHGDADGLFLAGEWLLGTHKPSEMVKGFTLVRYAASRTQASSWAQRESTKELSKAFLPELGITAVAAFEPNPRLAGAWLRVAVARGLGKDRGTYQRVVGLLGPAVDLPESEEQAWRWIKEEEAKSGAWPTPGFLAGSIVARPPARERVARLVTELAPIDVPEVRRLAGARPGGAELLEEVEQRGDLVSLQRLGSLISEGAVPGSRAIELGTRMLLCAAIAGDPTARRAMTKLGAASDPFSGAWGRLGGGGVSDDDAWDRIADGLRARYSDAHPLENGL